MKFCPNCGNELSSKTINNSLVKSCDSCGFIDWNNWINISCVVVAYTDEMELVLVRLKGKEQGKITFPGGYRELGESLIQAAQREFYEETGMIVDQLELFRTYTKDEQRLVWVVYKGKVKKTDFIDNDETSEVILVKNIKDINHNDLRGNLTERLLADLGK